MGSVLRDCYNTTDLDVQINPHGEYIEGLAQCLTNYLNFCADTVSLVKTATVTPTVGNAGKKDVFNEKKAAFRSRNR